MARPTKQGIDYFPIDCSFDDKTEMFLIEKGVIGLGVLITLWQMIYSNNGYYIDDNEDLHLLIKRKIDASINDIVDCINVGLRRDIFSKTMHESHGILTSKALQKRYFEAAKRKKEACLVAEFRLICVDSYENIVNANINPVNVSENATKVKEEVNVNVNVNTYGGISGKKQNQSKSSYTPEFEELWKAYPKRSGNNPKDRAFTAYKKQKAIHGHDALMDQVSKYSEYIHHTDRVQTEFVKQTSSFFGKDFDVDCEWKLPRQTGNGAKPDWAKIPRNDDDLWPWAKQNGYPEPGTQDYYQYRARLKSEVELRISREGLH